MPPAMLLTVGMGLQGIRGRAVSGSAVYGCGPSLVTPSIFARVIAGGIFVKGIGEVR